MKSNSQLIQLGLSVKNQKLSDLTVQAFRDEQNAGSDIISVMAAVVGQQYRAFNTNCINHMNSWGK